jgi:hypothetical protein
VVVYFIAKSFAAILSRYLIAVKAKGIGNISLVFCGSVSIIVIITILNKVD